MYSELYFSGFILVYLKIELSFKMHTNYGHYQREGKKKYGSVPVTSECDKSDCKYVRCYRSKTILLEVSCEGCFKSK